MRRFFLEEIDEKAAEAELSGEEFTHLKRVLRLGPGDEAALFNGKGVELTARIESVGSSSARLSITGRSEAARESPLETVLLQALLKGDKPEFIVQKATELGVSAICFYSTERTVAKISEDNAGKKLLRWKRASIEAAKQCGRTVLPRITLAEDLKSAAASTDTELKLLLWERDGARPLKEVISGKKPGSAAFLIGPEGGLSLDDARVAQNHGFKLVSMGPRILRAETAALAAATALQYALGDLG